MQEVESVREAFILQIEHNVDLALAVEIDALRAMPMGSTEAQAVKHPGELADLMAVIDELDELDELDGRPHLRRASGLLLEP